MTNHNFKELKVWQKAINLTKEVYLLLANFPNDERFGLVSQMKRAAISIPSNIAEGSGRNTNVEFARYLAIALGSAYELETQLILAEKLHFTEYLNIEPLIKELGEVQKMLYTLQGKFENSKSPISNLSSQI